jgi:hypothetical protein
MPPNHPTRDVTMADGGSEGFGHIVQGQNLIPVAGCELGGFVKKRPKGSGFIENR